MEKRITSHEDLIVYQKAFEAAMKVFWESQVFPKEERYSLTDQVRRSSRSVAANITEAWRKRRYEAAFIAKLSDAETEAAETQTWLRFATECGYLQAEREAELHQSYNEILRLVVAMIQRPDRWLLPSAK